MPVHFSMTNPVSPAMSVVITTPDCYQTIRKTMSYLRSQTARSTLEIIIVAPSRAELRLNESEMSDFGSYAVVEAGPVESIGRCNALGIRRAAAPIVALAEDHCFPDSDWAESLIAAHRGPWAVVGPAFRNANPETAISWADLFIGYGPFLWPTPSREVDFLPGHNSCYKRDVLLGYGDRLESMMESETVLHWDLRANGHRLYLESAARVAHMNFSLWLSWIPAQFLNGRLFAGARAREMSHPRRLAYAAGSPLIPLIRLIRIARAARSSQLLPRFFQGLPALIVGLAVDGVAQFVGYLLGAGDTLNQIGKFEFNRVERITEHDRRQVLAE
jgi:GT2 family glycosyltransferase